ncbi:hypothetical protein [Terrarubrum flagellatum]|uniref:hypothetical protein n=1 Tax=Terrirubrum flagellatum TaxID=2895980 RepID=UPI0031455F34
MASVTYFVVIPFEADEDGELTAGEPIEARTPSGAIFRAKAVALSAGGAIAFSRTGDPSLGEFEDAVVLAREGITPDDLAAYVGTGA